MNILVIGCDQVGASLVRDLERIGHDISIIEKDSEQLKRLDAFDDYTFSGNALVGDPTDPDVLRQGGIENCDAVAAVSEDDSLNLMAAQIAKSLFQREKVICRVSDPHLQVLYMNDLLAEVTDPEKKASILQEFRDYKEAADHRQPGIDALAEEIEKRKAWINHNLGKKQPKHEARKILKEKREELATMKKIQRSEYGRSYAAIKALKNMEKDKKNLLECLVVLGQGGETDEIIAG